MTSIVKAHGIFAAGAALAGGALGLRIPLLERSTLDLDPVDSGQPPCTVPVTEGHSGPVVVQVSYRVAPANLPPFFAVMDDLWRIWLRDGARRWVLSRDSADSNLWVECYSAPTWLGLAEADDVGTIDATRWQRPVVYHESR